MMIYYAHPMTLYNTTQENLDMELLRTMSSQIYNPNADEAAQIGYKVCGMDYFRPIIESCTHFAFRAFPDGSIPAGVAKELAWAQRAGLHIFELPSCIHGRTMDVEETREFLTQMGRS